MYYENMDILKGETMKKYSLDEDQVSVVHPSDLSNIVSMISFICEDNRSLAKELLDSIDYAMPSVLIKQLKFLFPNTNEKLIDDAIFRMVPFIFERLIYNFVDAGEGDIEALLYIGKKSRLNAKRLEPLLFMPGSLKLGLLDGTILDKIEHKALFEFEDKYEDLLEAIPTGNVYNFKHEISEVAGTYIPENRLIAVGHILRREWRRRND